MRMPSIAAVAAVAACAALLDTTAGAQGLFDRLKSEVRRAVEDKVDEAGGEHAGPTADALAAAVSADSASAGAAAGGSVEGRWQGQLTPGGKKSIAAFGGFEIVVAGDASTFSYESTQKCFAELTGTDGQYEATFVTGQGVCGTHASVTLAADGTASVTWDDAPNTPGDQKVYAGTLRRTQQAWPRDAWSVGPDALEGYDVTGYRLGMSYENALAQIESDPDMQHEWQIIATANGNGTISTVEKLKKGKGPGISFAGETLSLQFEAQTPEEMRVAPDSRPQGADAELLVIYRTLTFPNDARPNVDNVTAALIEKYGQPSIRTDDRRALEWVFDPEGNRIADAANGPCDQATPAGKQNKSSLTHYYGPIPGWVSPECGLTVVTDLSYQDDGGLYQMRLSMFDQRRLLGDGWYQTVQLSRARVADEKAALEATKAVDTPAL